MNSIGLRQKEFLLFEERKGPLKRLEYFQYEYEQRREREREREQKPFLRSWFDYIMERPDATREYLKKEKKKKSFLSLRFYGEFNERLMLFTEQQQDGLIRLLTQIMHLH